MQHNARDGHGITVLDSVHQDVNAHARVSGFLLYRVCECVLDREMDRQMKREDTEENFICVCIYIYINFSGILLMRKMEIIFTKLLTIFDIDGTNDIYYCSKINIRKAKYFAKF